MPRKIQPGAPGYWASLSFLDKAIEFLVVLLMGVALVVLGYPLLIILEDIL